MANERRLIDANALLAEVVKAQALEPNAAVAKIIMLVTEAERVDAVEVVHGRWEWFTDRCEDLFLGCDDDYGWRCSGCKVPLDDEDDPEVMPTFRYCPHCGAKMDGERREGE